MKLISMSKLALIGMFISSASVFAEEGAHAATGGSFGIVAVGLAMALAVIGAATAQGKIGTAFMDGVSRNPGAQKSMFVPLILSLVFVETLVLFTFLVAQSLLGKF
ncbi:MAG: ATP synthase F0 subunit C [Deltaproteobacteria bacterium]|nr:ATP synthase F0 subunit C [Deltaproteobacteria bacterium]